MAARTGWRGIAEQLTARPVYAVLIALVLVAVSFGLAVQNERIARAESLQRLTVQGQILAGSVAAPLAFDDRATTQEYLDALKANTDIEAVGAYDTNGTLAAGFTRDAALPATNPIHPAEVHHGEMIVTLPVAQAGVPMGSVYLRAALEPWTHRAVRYVGIAVVVIMAALLIVMLGASFAAAAETNQRLRREMEARRIAEEALRQSQKMEAMGQLTGGVAHDFNNLLMAASSGLELMERTSDPVRLARLKQGIRQALDRGAKLTQQLLTFARRSPLKPEVIDVAGRIAAFRDLLDRSLRENVIIRIDMPPGLWPVEVDPSQFEVAVLNVAVNARDAMPNGGTLTITARNLPADAEDDHDRIALALSDEGEGMPSELVEKVFEPFFTTKGVGHGTGLGLSQVYGFVRAAGGTVRIDSAPGTGTKVTMILPRADGTPSVQAASAVTPAAAPEQRRVLLAEDDEAVADLARQMLEELGYAVTRAADGQAALALVDRGLEIDVLLSDMMMPGEIDGLALARELRRRRPRLPVVLMTGYSAVAAAAGQEGLRLLTKPFTLDDLAAALSAEIELGGS
ncbi:MAG TPA: response regulator [Sphingomonas sp.]|nr:response regulator [Sphingomonas sp.]